MHPRRIAESSPDKLALVLEPSGHTRTYRQLTEAANRAAGLFHTCGLAPGDRVAFCLENRLEIFDFCWGAHQAGLNFVPMSSRLTNDEATYILNDSGAKLLLMSGNVTANAATISARCQHVQLFSLDSDDKQARDWHRELRHQTIAPLADQRGAPMFYSSGTTGKPKGILRPPPADEAAEQALANLMRALLDMNEESLYLCPAPLYHSAPLTWTMAVQRMGATAVIMEEFAAEAALALIAKHAITQAQFVPTHFIRFLRLPSEIREKYSHLSLRAVVHAAAPCPIEIKKQMLGWWGAIVHEYYAGSESNGVTFITGSEWLKRPGSVGRAIVGTVHICDDQGLPTPPGSEGLIYFADGPDFAYHNAPEKTASTRNDRGWTTLGDIGQIDDDGYLYLTDRQDFMIICGGVNVYPQEIENHLATHPKVSDVAVLGGPDPEMGERVIAVVQAREPQDSTAQLAAELEDYCRSALSSIKVPKQFDFVSELPRAPTGKLYKKLLRDQYWRANR